MRSSIAGILAPLALGAASSAFACGACLEDKIAATYDYAVASDAVARHRVVVFAAVEGPGDASEGAQALAAAAARVKGVERASIRTAANPRAISFVLDPKAATPEKALAAISAKSTVHGLTLSLIRVMS
jgi:hypothetical protein